MIKLSKVFFSLLVGGLVIFSFACGKRDSFTVSVVNFAGSQNRVEPHRFFQYFNHDPCLQPPIYSALLKRSALDQGDEENGGGGDIPLDLKAAQYLTVQPQAITSWTGLEAYLNNPQTFLNRPTLNLTGQKEVGFNYNVGLFGKFNLGENYSSYCKPAIQDDLNSIVFMGMAESIVPENSNVLVPVQYAPMNVNVCVSQNFFPGPPSTIRTSFLGFLSNLNSAQCSDSEFFNNKEFFFVLLYLPDGNYEWVKAEIWADGPLGPPKEIDFDLNDLTVNNSAVTNSPVGYSGSPISAGYLPEEKSSTEGPGAVAGSTMTTNEVTTNRASGATMVRGFLIPSVRPVRILARRSDGMICSKLFDSESHIYRLDVNDLPAQERFKELEVLKTSPNIADWTCN